MVAQCLFGGPAGIWGLLNIRFQNGAMRSQVLDKMLFLVHDTIQEPLHGILFVGSPQPTAGRCEQDNGSKQYGW